MDRRKGESDADYRERRRLAMADYRARKRAERGDGPPGPKVHAPAARAVEAQLVAAAPEPRAVAEICDDPNEAITANAARTLVNTTGLAARLAASANGDGDMPDKAEVQAAKNATEIVAPVVKAIATGKQAAGLAALAAKVGPDAQNRPQEPPRTVEDAMVRLGRTGPTWAAWRTVARLLDGSEFSEQDRQAFADMSGMEAPPRTVSELYAVIGRRGGKTSFAALVSVVWACRSYPAVLAPEVIMTANRMDQAKKTLGFAREAARQLGVLEDPGNTTSFGVKGGCRVVVYPNSSTAVRGPEAVAVVMDEAAFYPSDPLAADTDRALFTAIKPTLATIRNGLMMLISTPGPETGILAEAFQSWKRGERPAGRVVLHAVSRKTNPTLSQSEIDAEIAEHPELRTEYAAEFHADSRAWLPSHVTDHARIADLPAVQERGDGELFAFVDVAGGGARDGFAAAVAEALEPGEDERPRARLLEVVHWEPPFNVDDAIKETAAFCRKYGLDEITGDRWATPTAGVSWNELGVTYRESERSTSLIYQDVAGALISGRAVLLNEPLLISQLRGLVEVARQTPPPRVDHVNGGHDDVACAACGALRLALEHEPVQVWTI